MSAVYNPGDEFTLSSTWNPNRRHPVTLEYRAHRDDDWAAPNHIALRDGSTSMLDVQRIQTELARNQSHTFISVGNTNQSESKNNVQNRILFLDCAANDSFFTIQRLAR